MNDFKKGDRVITFTGFGSRWNGLTGVIMGRNSPRSEYYSVLLDVLPIPYTGFVAPFEAQELLIDPDWRVLDE